MVNRSSTPPQCVLDLDGNDAIDALTDGLLIVRALFGLTGTAVTNGAIGPNATRTTWSMFGLSRTTVTNSAVGANPTRGTGADLRGYMNGNCGTTFSQ